MGDGCAGSFAALKMLFNTLGSYPLFPWVSQGCLLWYWKKRACTSQVNWLERAHLGSKGCQGSQRQQLGICSTPFSSLKSLMCVNSYSGERRLNLRSLLLILGRKWVPQWEYRGAQSPCPGFSDVFCDLRGSQLKGFVPSQSCFLPGDSNLFPNLHQTPIPGAPAELRFTFLRCQTCNTRVSLASCTCGFLGLSTSPVQGFEVCLCVHITWKEIYFFTLWG